eukprot:TRINITY_DN2096_c0_g1_i3.p1 TRINITY_DN2096_c0_g1~~TRINITY_DN2096_c0_g1_i3.p1  ORF type:complete len:145 (-),score=26.62 TRINITY_DN2096_c0_g1_i3:3-437(-)
MTEVLDAQNDESQTPLEYAIQSRAEEAALALISPFTSHRIRGVMGSVLHLAADRGLATVCDALIKNGCLVNERNSREETPLFRACCAYPESPEAVRVFLDHNADTWAQDKFGKTALEMAESRKYWESAELIKAYRSGSCVSTKK